RTPVTDNIMDDTIDFHTSNTVLDQHPDVRYPPVIGFLIICQRSVAWLLLRLKDIHSWQSEALKSTILRQHTSIRQLILSFICDAFVVYSPGVCRTQEPYAPTRIHDNHIFDRMVFLLAAVVDFLFFGIFRSRYWPFCGILAKKGAASGSLSTISTRIWAANSDALRAGSSCCCAKAAFRMSSSNRTHLLTFDWLMPNSCPCTSSLAFCLR